MSGRSRRGGLWRSWMRPKRTGGGSATTRSARSGGSAQDAAIFLTAPLTGLRMGELLPLRVRDVDFAANAIHVLGSYDYEAGVGTPKSGKGRCRSCPTPPPHLP